MRRIKSATIQRLALCKRGKNKMTTLFKAEGGRFEMSLLTKEATEKGELLAVMWPKGLLDSDGDFADTDQAISSMASSFIQNGGALDLEHDGKVLPKEAAYVTEIFTIQKSDERFAGWLDYDDQPQDVSGGVAVKIQIDDPGLRESYRSGEWDGVSVFGPAAVEQVDLKAASQRVAAKMGSNPQMNEKEMQAALDAQKAEMVALFKSAIDEVKAAVKPVEKEVEKSEDDEVDANPAPTFTGDPMDEAALKEYESALRGFEMRKAILSGDLTADGIAEMRKSLTEVGPSLEDLSEYGAKADDSAKVRALQVELFKAQNESNAPARNSNVETAQEQLAKAQAEESKLLAGLLNSKPSTSGMRIVG